MSFQLRDYLDKKEKIGVVGLGYVGLPLLISFEKYFSMVGFDVSKEKIQQLRDGVDVTDEVGNEVLSKSQSTFSADPEVLKDCSTIIVAVPTPIDQFKTPDLTPVISATKLIAANLKPGAIIVYESTVYPGVTEEVCKPILEEYGHEYLKDFFLGYSPERINPGDKERRFETILKIVSGDTEECAEFLSSMYGTVVKAGIHQASSIKVAEAAKVIENVQRDVNIALMNELAILFDQVGIDTREVLKAAGTKWNFVKLNPGLVGGHCIGVDPYYLTYKAEQLGYHPQIITAGRRINDGMAKYVAEQTVKRLIEVGNRVKGSRVLVLGVTFKANVPDTRNSKVKDLIHELKDYGLVVHALDPHVSDEELQNSFRVDVVDQGGYEALVYAVNHNEFSDVESLIDKYSSKSNKLVFIDIQAIAEEGALGEEVCHWRL